MGLKYARYEVCEKIDKGKYSFKVYSSLGNTPYGPCGRPEEDCIYVGVFGPGWISVYAYVPLDINGLKKRYSATGVVVKRFRVKAVKKVTNALEASFCNYQIHYPLDNPIYGGIVPGGFDGWIDVGLDVSQYGTVCFGFLVDIDLYVGWSCEWWIHNVEIVYEVETEQAMYTVTVTVSGIPDVENVKVSVDNIQSGLTDKYGVVVFTLPPGAYTFKAVKIFEGEVWSGSVKAEIRMDTIVSIVMKPPTPPYMNLIYISLAIIGVTMGLLTASRVVEALKKK